MATIVFQAAGAALGGVFGPVGAVIGRAIGGLAGNAVDRALLGGGKSVTGARLSTARIPGASEGTAINRLYGTARIGGTLIWATRFEEEAVSERSGGKAGGTKTTTFRYFANLAIGLCEGPVAGLRRVWADGREIDLTDIEMRLYRGSDDQPADPLIEAKQGTGQAPAYRGLAYVVFERLPLDPYGNRIPVLQFEVMRPVGRLESQIRAVTLIPGATEHGYATEQVREVPGDGSARIINRNTLTASTDWQASLDELQALCPNLKRVALVSAWFGTDLRAGHCQVVPGVEVEARAEESTPWSVSGVARADAYRVSRHNGGPAYGGTPNDKALISAIADLKARGLKVYLYPFLMMDIETGNGLPDPYGGAAQAPYPWRGRITCDPAPGQPGTADRSNFSRTQIAAFCGTAAAADFELSDGAVTYTGTEESYRRMVLHHALLAVQAGGVDGFVIGSELRGLSTLRDGSGAFPFVEQLVTLAADVRAIVGAGTKITYGADWSEYFGYQPADGSGEVWFHLDPLWASSAIDAVGIDNYLPLSDWRDDDLTSANPDGFRLADDGAAMAGQIFAGEGFDWYYASEAARAARIRAPISDGLAQKPWVFRPKDIFGWWSNAHYNRSGGAEHGTPTAWVPGAKPVWFTELGCAAIDKGANQPNVFADPKSAESALPYFSSGSRADSQQRRFLEAHHAHWQQLPAGTVDPDHVFVWTWDARPFPAFPHQLDVWSDGGNWHTGHWLNGRLGGGTLADVIAAILDDHGFADYDVSEVSGDLAGYVQGEVASARGLIEPLLQAFQIDVVESAGKLLFRSRLRASLPAEEIAVLADIDGEPLWRETRGHDSDFAGEAIVTFYDAGKDYEQASVRSRRVASATSRVLTLDLAAVMPEETALSAAENYLRDHRVGRRTLEFALGPDRVDIEPGDVLQLAEGPKGRFLVSRIEDGFLRKLSLREVASALSGRVTASGGGRVEPNPAASGFAPILHFLDLPRYRAGAAEDFASVAVLARPWRPVAISSSATVQGYATGTVLQRPATIGRLAADFVPDVTDRFARAQTLELALSFGEMSSASKLSVLDGANRMAVLCANGAWEVFGFATAQELAPDRWRLSDLLRGLAGTEDATAAGALAGAPVVLLDAAVRPLGLTPDEAGRALNFIAEPVGGSGMAGPVVFSGGLRAETPLSPVHLRGRRVQGAIEIGWIRRGRIDADDWEAAEIALDEEFERYRLEIFDGALVRRTVDVSQPSYSYAGADELSDFGAAQESLSIRVRQLGRKVPLGLPAQAVIFL